MKRLWYCWARELSTCEPSAWNRGIIEPLIGPRHYVSERFGVSGERGPARTRWTIRKTGASSSGCVANSKRSGIGNESTHWRTGTPRDDVIDQVGGGLRHAPDATARAEAATLATEGHKLFMGTVGATQA
jgi:hypothetical protein